MLRWYAFVTMFFVVQSEICTATFCGVCIFFFFLIVQKITGKNSFFQSLVGRISVGKAEITGDQMGKMKASPTTKYTFF